MARAFRFSLKADDPITRRGYIDIWAAISSSHAGSLSTRLSLTGSDRSLKGRNIKIPKWVRSSETEPGKFRTYCIVDLHQDGNQAKVGASLSTKFLRLKLKFMAL